MNSVYAAATVARPSHSAIAQPRGCASHERSTSGIASAPTTAALAPIAPTTVKASHPASSSRRCTLAMTAKLAPAPTAPATPTGSVPPDPADPPKPSSTTPVVASAVAPIQVALGRRRVSAHSSSPASTGADPSAMTVLTATPLRAVPRKNSG